MIAYKLFEEHQGKLYPWYPKIKSMFQYYNPKYIITRAEGCGPFACFKTASQALSFSSPGYWDVLYKVQIKRSKDKRLWIDDDKRELALPHGTILADEFEILERVE